MSAAINFKVWVNEMILWFKVLFIFKYIIFFYKEVIIIKKISMKIQLLFFTILVFLAGF